MGGRRKEFIAFRAWSIEDHFDWGRGLLGRFYFNREMEIPSHLLGCQVALFATRAEARVELAEVNKRTWTKRKARVISVDVKIARTGA